MKRILLLVLSALLLCGMCACSGGKAESETPSPTTENVSQAEPTEAPLAVDQDIQSAVEDTASAHGFEGVIYAAREGRVVASFADGTLENGEDITLDSPMPVGSVSKQFCAAAILLLQERGRLSISDTLDKYFPEYEQGSKITLKDMLCMRSGIPEASADGNEDLVSGSGSEEELIEALMGRIFESPLDFEPDSAFAYTNTNYFLLACVVERASDVSYDEFLRESFFEPLGMNDTCTFSELAASPDMAGGQTYYKTYAPAGLTKGCGDLISNARDITAWLNALAGGRVISADSYALMTTDYTPSENYGFGLYLELSGGVGHYGCIGIYSAFDYISADKGVTVFAASNTIDPITVQGLASDLLSDITGQ